MFNWKSPLRCWTWLSLFSWIGALISIAKTASKKIGALICSMKFLSPEVALYLYKSMIQSCMEYFCNVWAGAPANWNCWISCKNGTSFEPLTNYQNVPSWSLSNYLGAVGVNLTSLSSKFWPILSKVSKIDCWLSWIFL